MTELAFDNSKLRGRIIEKYGSLGDFSKEVCINRSSVSRMLNGFKCMKREDIILFCSALDIGPGEIGDYFFRKKVVKS